MGQRRKIQRSDVTVRLAQNEDGPVIAELVKNAPLEFEGWEPDWSKVHPHWLIADYQGKPMGCIQLCYGRPFFRVEILGIRAEAPKRLRVFVLQKIADECIKIASAYGASAVCAVIPFELAMYRRVAKRRGWGTVATGNMIMMRVT